jgi:hypothetical protein
MKVGFVALKAKEWFVLLQQVVSNRTMGSVTGSAVLCNRLMLEDKGPLLGSMAVQTQVVLPF